MAGGTPLARAAGELTYPVGGQVVKCKTMKAFSLILPALLLFAPLSTVDADVTDKLIGKWSGTATATSGGVAIPENVTTVFRRLEKKGLLITTTVKVSGQPSVLGTSRYHDNGKVDGELKLNGAVVAVVSGTWGISDKVLKANVKANGLFPSFRITSKTTLAGANRITIVGTTSSGERSVGALTRK